MDDSVITLIWLAVGLLLMAAELFLPGLVVVFLGVSAVVVALLRWVGLVTDLPMSFLAWMVISIALVVGLRGAVRRWFPPEESKGETDEDLAAFGTVVDVVEDCHEADDEAPTGRIRFQGSTWPAMSASGVVKKGQRAKLVYRQNLTWVVEPVELPLLDEGDGDAVPTRSDVDKAAG